MTYADTHMCKDGSVENCLLVVNMKEQNVLNIPYKLMRGVLGYVSAIVKGKMRGIYVINAPTTFSMLWTVIKGFIDENTAKKV